jgi:hypothetical protein
MFGGIGGKLTVAKGILISPMYINIKSLGELWVIPPYATCDLYKTSINIMIFLKAY